MKPGWWNGRHRGLKIPRSLRPCRFKSGSGYHPPLIDGTIAKLVRPQPAKLLFAGSSPAGSSMNRCLLDTEQSPASIHLTKASPVGSEVL